MQVQANVNQVENPIKKAVSAIESKQTSIVKNDYIIKNLQVDSEKQQAELRRYNNDTNLKAKLTNFIIWFTVVWSLAIIILVYLMSFNICHLEKNVVITLLTETLCLTLGLPSIVVSHFFPKK